MNYYIGLDAHSQTCTAVVVNEKGEQKLRATFETTEAKLIEFISKVEGVKHLTFEECTLSQWLYVTLFVQNFLDGSHLISTDRSQSIS